MGGDLLSCVVGSTGGPNVPRPAPHKQANQSSSNAAHVRCCPQDRPTSKPKTTKMPKITNTVPSKLKGQREEILRIATTGSIATAIQGIKIFLDEQFYMNEFASLQPKLWMCRTLQKIPMSYAPLEYLCPIQWNLEGVKAPS